MSAIRKLETVLNDAIDARVITTSTEEVDTFSSEDDPIIDVGLDDVPVELTDVSLVYCLDGTLAERDLNKQLGKHTHTY